MVAIINTNGNQSNSDIAIDNQGTFVVVWEGEGVGDNQGIFARRFDREGFDQLFWSVQSLINLAVQT